MRKYEIYQLYSITYISQHILFFKKKKKYLYTSYFSEVNKEGKMNSKKLLVVFSLLTVFVLSVGVVSAFNLGDFVKGLFGGGKVTGNSISEISSNGLVLQYSFQENTNYTGVVGEIVDGSGTGNHGTTSGGVVATSGNGVDGKSALFGGYDQRVSTNVKIAPAYMKNVTFGGWAKPTNPSYQAYQGFAGADNYYDRSFGIYNGYWQVQVGDGIWAIAAPNWNQWQHVMVVYTPTNILFYLNGVQYSYGNSGGNFANNANFEIGKDTPCGSNCLFQGLIDEVTIWNRSLSANEISTLYSNQSTRLINAPTPVNGVCGATLNSCISGTFLNIADNSTHYLWNCMGYYGGASVSCSLLKSSNQTYLLNVAKFGTGTGTVVSSPPGIDCGMNCSNFYGSETAISLLAIPEVNSYFDGWAGCFTSAGSECYFVMSNFTKEVRAVFQKNNTNQTATCTDSDGANLYEKGFIDGLYYNYNDYNLSQPFYYHINDSCMFPGNIVNEMLCGSLGHPIANPQICPNGCSDGACLPEPPQVCQPLIDKVKNPIDFTDNNGNNYTMQWNSTYYNWNYVNGNQENYTDYYASWQTYVDGKYNSFSTDVSVFDNKQVNLTSILDDQVANDICQVQSYYVGNGENKVYVCNWGVLIDDKYQANTQFRSKSRTLVWVNDNVLVRIYLSNSEWLSDEEFKTISSMRLNNFIQALDDNQFKNIDWSNFNVDYPLYTQVEDSLSSCSSDVSLSTNYNYFDCKIEPVVCPEYGYQNRVCKSWDQVINNWKVQTAQIPCSPGICSGCYVPRWLSSVGDNTCIPYGTRFVNEQTNKGEDDLPGGIHLSPDGNGGYNLIIVSDYEAIFNIWGTNKDGLYNYTFNLYENNEFRMPDGIDGAARLFIKQIVINGEEEGNGHILFTLVENFNAYCNYNGQIMEQKKGTSENPVSCQNNYECDSNLCSSGKCVEVQQLIKEAGTFKRLAVRVLCRLSSVFDSGNYEQCIIDYLGDSTSPSSGGGGGGSVTSLRESESSNLSCSLTQGCGRPTGLAANLVNGNDLSLTWSDNSNDEASFSLECREYGSLSWSESDLPTIPANSNAYVISDFMSSPTFDACGGDSFEFRMYARKLIGVNMVASNYSNIALAGV